MPEHVSCLNRRRFGQRNQAISQRGIEISLRDVQSDLRALRGQLDVGRAPSGVRYLVLGDNTPAGEQALRKREPKIVLVLGAEAQTSERRERVAPECAAIGILESREPLGSRCGSVSQVLVAGSRRRSWLGGVDGGTAAAKAGEL